MQETACKRMEILCRPCFLKTNTIVFHSSGFPAATTLDICPPTTNVCFTIMLNELEISKKFLTLLFLGMLSTYFHLQQEKLN